MVKKLNEITREMTAPCYDQNSPLYCGKSYKNTMQEYQMHIARTDDDSISLHSIAHLCPRRSLWQRLWAFLFYWPRLDPDALEEMEIDVPDETLP